MKLLSFEDVVPEASLDTLLEDIVTTVWDAPLSETQASRERVAKALGVEPPAAMPSQNKRAPADEMESYGSLVREAGY